MMERCDACGAGAFKDSVLTMRMKQIHPTDVRLITLDGKTLTLILKNDEIVSFKYSSEMEAAWDLKHWETAHFTEVQG